MMFRYLRLFSGPLLLLLFGLAPVAHADCVFASGNTTTVNFAVTSPVNIPFDLPATGTVLASDDATPSNPPDLTCTAGTTYGVVNRIDSGSPVGGTNYIYPTGLSGVGYQLVHDNNTGSFMGPYPTYTYGGGTSTFSVGTTLKLVQTGPIANGSSLAAGTRLADWEWGGIVPEYFVLSNQVTFAASACTWNTAVAVTLPTLSTQDFTGAGTNAGETAFSIPIQCPTGSTASTLVINLTATLVNGSNHVIKNGTKVVNGGAKGVGVELVDTTGANPVVFDGTGGSQSVSVPVGSAPTGAGTISLFARYCATSNTVTAGDVQATATFNLTYN